MARSFLFVVFLCALFGPPAAGAERHSTVTGQIVAYSSSFLGCLNGNAYWEMIIHVRDGKRASARFIEVSFSVPCDRSPEWLFGKQTTQKFHLIRDKRSDGVLEEFFNSVNESTGERIENDPSLPIWKLVPGAEQEKLPFGQIVRGYLSADFPPAPLF